VSGPILTVNAGSSSLKLRVIGDDDELISEHESGAVEDEEALQRGLAQALEDSADLWAVGHRVVHGGETFTGPVAVDAGVEADLGRLADLAPLHNPPAVAAMRAVEALAPALPAVACFDTAFHRTLPAAASTYALPAEWRERWPIRRYGFHGLSHAYAARRASQLLDKPMEDLRLVTAHLGAGASLAAVEGGRSVDTTMGFTPLEGLVMATRSGSTDPGLILWLQRHENLSTEEIEISLDREAGLLGLSGRSGDMRDVVEGMDDGDEACKLAFDVYLQRLVSSVGGMAAAMNGIDALVFTGGVGENSSRVRDAAGDRLGFLGVEPSSEWEPGSAGDAVLCGGGGCAVAVVAAREDLEIAAQVRATLAPSATAAR